MTAAAAVPVEPTWPAGGATVRARTAADVRANVAWYRRSHRDPTTRLGPTWLLRAMLTPHGPATGKLDWSTGTVTAYAWGPGADYAVTTMPAMAGPAEPFPPPPAAHRLVTEAARRLPYLGAGRSGDLYHSLLPAVVEQRITAGEALRQWARLVGRLGEEAPGPFPGLLLPPSPDRLASTPLWWFHPLGIERKRAAALIAVARTAHRLHEWADLPDMHETARKLALIPGVGPWTIGVAMGPACGDDDAVPIGDYHFPNAVAWNLAAEPRGDDARMLELLEPYEGQRGRALRLILAAGRRQPAFGPKRRILPMHRF